MIFLGLIPIAQFSLMLLYLGDFHKSFSKPLQSIPYVLILLKGLLQPFRGISDNSFQFLALLLLAGTATIMAYRNGKRWIHSLIIAAMVIGAIVSSHETATRVAKPNPRKNHLISQPLLEPNDWDKRGYRWTTLIGPFNPVRGHCAFGIKGKIAGDCVPVLAIREGAQTLIEQTLP